MKKTDPADPTLNYQPSSEQAAGLSEDDLQAKTGQVSVQEVASLVRADQRRRWQQGERVSVETYILNFPSLKQSESAKLDLLYNEALLREERGEAPSPREYTERFPELADQIERQFRLHAALKSNPVAPSPVSDTVPPVRTWNQRPASQATVQGYEIVKELGRGGMGVVYKAHHQGLKRTVALKMILSGAHAGSEELFRFRTEAEAVASLQHPNIVQIYEVGEQEGRPFFSLEFVDGGSLDDKLAHTSPLPPREAAQLIEKLARAMHVAHQRGIIHRDLKPANVLLTSDGNPKITDFGLAKRLDSQQGQTQSGSIMGTPSYMAPEQAAGNTREVGTLSDVYALGAILYETLTGRPPFDSDNPMDTVLQVINDEPAAPSKLNPKVPRDLETICLKCLEKLPRKRYASAQDLADDLRRYLDEEPILARPIGAWERGVKWMRRRPAVAASLFVVALAAIALIASGIWYHVRLQGAFTDVERARDDAKDAHRTAVVQLIKSRLANGMQQADSGDLLGALPWFAEVLTRDEGDPRWEPMHRTRLGTILRQCPRPVQMFFHDGRVTGAAFSPDGQWVATSCSDRKARIWNSATGEPVGAAMPHEDVIDSITYSPKGDRVATASEDCTARIWDAASGKPITPPLRHEDSVAWARFSPDGKQLVTASEDGTARVWDASTGKLVHTLNHDRAVRQAEFSPDGQHIVTASDDRTARIWDASSGKPTTPPLVHEGGVAHASFSADSAKIVTASADYTAKVWDARTGKALSPALKHPAPLRFAAFSPDGKKVVTGGDDNKARIWDAADGHLLTAPLRHGSNVYEAHFTPDGKSIVTCSDDNSARVWNAETGDPESIPLKHNATVYTACLHPTEKRLLTASADGTARIWEAGTNELAGPTLRHQDRVTSVRFSPKGHHVLTTSHDGTAKLWDAATGKPIGVEMKHDRVVHRGLFSRDGRQVVTCSADKTARVWDAETGKAITPPLTHSEDVRHAEFSPDGRRVATASWDKTARVWDASSGQSPQEFKGHTGEVNWAAFSPDGTRLVTASNDDTARVWDVATGKPVGEPMKHGEDVNRAVFSPDGKRIVTASNDRTARVWDAATGTPLTAPMKHASKVFKAVFSPDGDRVLTASDDDTARVWETQTGKPVTLPMRHTGTVNRATFGPEGRRVVTGSEDNTARLWDAHTGEPITPPLPHHGGVVDVDFSPDGNHVATAGSDKVARIWNVAPDRRSVSDLVLLSKFLSGGWIDDMGSFAPMDATEMRETWNKIRQFCTEHLTHNHKSH
ncbi:MAG: protein kinase [Gemmataceae bacterium]|nr:protein kinase [Gemmataceae bacterium]